MKNIILMLLAIALILTGCKGQKSNDGQDYVIHDSDLNEIPKTRAVFAWYGIEQSDIHLFEKYSINTVLLDNNHMEDMSLLEPYRVLLLCGHPSWGIEEMTSAVEEAEKSGADGICFDIENSYPKLAENLEALHTSFPVYCCIPFWLDSMTASETESDMTGHELTDRIIRATDGVYIMNYYKENEREQINSEINLCERYHKEIVTIYELQPSGLYDLEEYNTYYTEGLLTVEKNYETMFNGTKVGIAFHNLAMMRRLDKRD